MSWALQTCYAMARFFEFVNLESLVGSENLKKAGANSTSHLGSTVVTSRMYSLVVCTTSWNTTHSGWRWKSAELGWMDTIWESAMLVAITTFLAPGGAGSNILLCISEG